jgi:hypothetical protein
LRDNIKIKKITFYSNDNEIPEVGNKKKSQNVDRKKNVPPREGYVQHIVRVKSKYFHGFRESLLSIKCERIKTTNPVLLKIIECFFKVDEVYVFYLYV